ncbi:hypothetical protein JJV70_01905, partial [Streptomyces sp. JJ66]|uniref:hypothetical protein n=1 Tax=Streptomyces sp. JJ66 TaxID=2803843 RepID=UPI001C5C7B7C|nr:hypothetical protein [Streptomyces sp. JJ66]
SPPQQTPADEPQQEPPPRPLIEDRAAFLHWLADLIGDANGIHLDPLHRALTQQPGCTLPRPHLGPLLDRLDVPYQRTMSVGGIAGRSGVRRADVEAALTALPQGTPQATSETSHSAPDLRKSQPLSTALTPTLSPSQEP